MSAREDLLPGLTLALGLGDAFVVAPRLRAARDAGVGAILLEAGAASPDAVRAAVAALRAEMPGAIVLVAGSPAVAGEFADGAVLPERGMGSSEARRLLGPGRWLGREAGSAAAAELAEGVDFVLMSLAEAGAGGIRHAAGRGWSPVLARVDSPGEAAAALTAGAEGLVIPAAAIEHAGTFAALIPARSTEAAAVTLDGVVVPLQPDTAVTDLLADAGISAAAVVVNGVPVPRRSWDDRMLESGDRIETR